MPSSQRQHLQLTASALAALASLASSGCKAPAPKLRPGTPPTTALSEAAGLDAGSPKRDRIIARTLGTLAESPREEHPDITLRWSGRDGYAAFDFDRFIPASTQGRRSWRRDWHTRPGDGSPLVLTRDDDGGRFVGKLGTAQPATAILAATADGYQITLHDSLAPEVGAGDPIARDFTAPVAYLMGREHLMPGLRAVFAVDKYIDELGLYGIDPFDPDKIPLVLVHGLKSNPKVWVDMVNAVNADDEIRSNYQVWLYSYPTGVPILYSAMRLRQELQAFREQHDPGGQNPNLDRMVVVGHSMGGIITRMLVSSSSDRLRGLISAPARDREISPEILALAREALVFEPQRYIGRAVFIAAPHRGSEVARGRIVHRLARLIRLPGELTRTILAVVNTRLDTTSPDGLPPDFAMPNGVEDLDPDSRFMWATAEQPVAAGIPFHSIIAIGEDGPGKPLEETDDSLVGYTSAHLDGAESELTVADSHNTYDHPVTIAEVSRILKLHLQRR